MLFAFVQDQRNRKDNDLFVTYFVAGISKPVNGVQTHKCTVLPEEQLNSYKSTLATVTSSHIYSVQKSKVKDSNTLYTSDYDVIKEHFCDSNKYSAIKYSKAKLRSAEEISKLEATQRKEQQTTQPTNNTKPQNGNSSANGHNITNSTISGSSNKTQKKAGIAGMFANAASNKNKNTEAKDVKTEQTEDKKPAKQAETKKKGGMMSFFAKQEKSPVKEDEVGKDQSKTKKESPPPQTKNKTEPKTKADGTRKTRRNQDSDDESKSKRRRIKEDLFDSSSEEEVMECEESPIPSPAREPSPAPESPVIVDDNEEDKKKEDSPRKESPEQKNSAPGERRRKRTRKLVPKTFMDEEGYMVTEKVWESDSTDASDVEPQPKKEVPKKTTPDKKSPQKKSPKKKSPPDAGSRKQASLMSFFKKK